MDPVVECPRQRLLPCSFKATCNVLYAPPKSRQVCILRQCEERHIAYTCGKKKGSAKWRRVALLGNSPVAPRPSIYPFEHDVGALAPIGSREYHTKSTKNAGLRFQHQKHCRSDVIPAHPGATAALLIQSMAWTWIRKQTVISFRFQDVKTIIFSAPTSSGRV
jgi:hypothetical protein